MGLIRVTGPDCRCGSGQYVNTKACAKVRKMKKAVIRSLVCMAAVLGGQARADSVADFYRGKQVTMVIGYGPGGGYDIYGRIMAKYIGKHIPGNPTVIVQNMPGAGSMR